MSICSTRILSRLSCRKVSRRNFVSTTRSSNPQALTVLHQVSSLLPRILSDSNNLELWSKLLDHAYNVLSKPASSNKVKVVVYSVDNYTGARDLVTALIDDSISSTSNHSELLHNRPKDATITIENGDTAKLEDGRVFISSQWLQQFPAPVQLIEVPANNNINYPESLLSAEFPVMVINPITTPLQSLKSSYRPFLDHPNAILVVTGLRTTSHIDEFVQSLLNISSNVLYIDPSLALSSLQTFKSDPSSLKSIDTYQYGSLTSGIHDLSRIMKARITEMQETSLNRESGCIQRYTAVSIIKMSLRALRVAIADAKREVDGVTGSISEMRSRIAETRAVVERDIFGSSEGQESVTKALSKSKRDLTPAMDNLKWWKLFWRVDEVGENVASMTEKTWCKDLEQNLIMQAGRLSSLQEHFASSVQTLLSAYPSPSNFASPVLFNMLSQIQSSQKYPLTPTVLTRPIHSRISQLTTYSTSQLHLKAQRIVVGLYGSLFGGLGVSWAGWVGFAEPLLGLGAETSIGVGMLGAVFGLRWAVGKWEWEKKRWWADWERIGEGLGRDLKANLDRTLTENVFVVPDVTCQKLENMVRTRQRQIAKLEEQVDSLEEDSKHIQ